MSDDGFINQESESDKTFGSNFVLSNRIGEKVRLWIHTSMYCRFEFCLWFLFHLMSRERSAGYFKN